MSLYLSCNPIIHIATIRKCSPNSYHLCVYVYSTIFQCVTACSERSRSAFFAISINIAVFAFHTFTLLAFFLSAGDNDTVYCYILPEANDCDLF